MYLHFKCILGRMIYFTDHNDMYYNMDIPSLLSSLCFLTGGRLPQSWYYENYTQIDMSNMNMRPNQSTGYPGRTYRFFTGKPIWEFGYGLSYSKFSYSFIKAPASIMAQPLRHQLCNSDKAANLNCLDDEKGNISNSFMGIGSWEYIRITFFLYHGGTY